MKYTCPYCRKRYSAEDAYINHLKKHSPTYAKAMATGISIGLREREQNVNKARRRQ